MQSRGTGVELSTVTLYIDVSKPPDVKPGPAQQLFHRASFKFCSRPVGEWLAFGTPAQPAGVQPRLRACIMIMVEMCVFNLTELHGHRPSRCQRPQMHTRSERMLAGAAACTYGARSVARWSMLNEQVERYWEADSDFRV